MRGERAGDSEQIRIHLGTDIDVREEGSSLPSVTVSQESRAPQGLPSFSASFCESFMLRKPLSGAAVLVTLLHLQTQPCMERGASSGPTAWTGVQFIALICLVYGGPISR